MQRKIVLLALIIISVGVATTCSRSGQTPTSPTGVAGGSSALNPDGSNMKITSPGSLSPSGGATVDSVRPTLSFSNSLGRFGVREGLAYEIEINGPGGVVYSRVIGESANTSSHQVDTDLQFATDYSWRVRGRSGNDTGPWSGTATFRTIARPGPAPGVLPFPVPAECGPGGPANRLPCALAVASLSAEWAGCAGGSGIRCHRFARQVVFALAQSDPNFKMIVAAPGGNACNCNACGPSDGTMFREDTTVYGGTQVFDMIGGAGGPAPSLQWNGVGPPRPGDLPGDAPLCVP